MKKTVGVKGILNSDLISDQFFLQCVTTNILSATVTMSVTDKTFDPLFCDYPLLDCKEVIKEQPPTRNLSNEVGRLLLKPNS
jgi:hypothetical protein